ncbi:MAG: phage tail tape measure protein, partial [Phycisphaerae bacterium]|nr:phage tail tape measure protein [Phycisphaerae bacterium]
SILSLARATGTELPKAAEIAAGTLRAFSLAADQMGHVTDVMVATANNSAQTLEQLGDSMAYVAPIAEEYGLTLEETNKALGVMANMQIKGSMAGTSMRMMLLQLSDPSIRSQLQGMGVDLSNFGDTMLGVGKVMADMSGPERLAFAQKMFGKRAAGGALKLTKGGFDDLSNAIDNAAGTAKKTADEMDSGLGGTFRILKSAIEGVQIAIGEALAPTLKKLGEWVTKTAQSSIEWIKANKGLIVGLAATAVGVTLLGVGLMMLGVSAFLASVGLGALATIVAAISSPLGFLAAVVVGGTVAWMRYSESGKRAWASLKAAVLPIIETLKATIGGVKDALMAGDWGLAGKIAITGLKLAILQGLGAIQQAFPETFGTILRVVGKIGDGIVAAWGKVTGFLTDQWNNWGKQTLDTVMGVATRIPQIWQQAVEGMANWMLEASAKGGIMGKAMSKVLGVDMSQEQAKAELTESKARKVRLRNYQDAIKVIEDEIAAGKDVEVNQKLLKGTLSKIADLQAGGSGTAEGATVDVLADARKAVEDYTQSLMDNVAAIGGEAGTGKVSKSLEAFLTKLESGAGIHEAVQELAALRKEAAERSAEAGKGKDEGGGGGGPGAGGVGGAATALAPRGVALTATYSAAAARIAGYQPGGGPEERTAAGIESIDEGIKRTAAWLGDLVKQGMATASLFEQFLAGW